MAQQRGDTCREEVLAAFKALESRSGRDVFSPSEVVEEMEDLGTEYAVSTIRTHIVSRMCANAQRHHTVVYDDLQRVAPGLYRRLTE